MKVHAAVKKGMWPFYINGMIAMTYWVDKAKCKKCL